MLKTAFLKISPVLLLAVASLSCLQKKQAKPLPYYNTPDFTPQFIAGKQEALNSITHTIADFSFINQEGKIISEKNIEGKIHVANFIFTRCGSICPVLTRHMKQVDSAFKNNPEVQLLSFSVTPWMDSVPVLKKYAGANKINAANWQLLTSSKADVYKLARQSYFAEEDAGFTKDSTEFLHTEHILLVDKTKRIRGIYNGTLKLEILQLIADIKELLEEE